MRSLSSVGLALSIVFGCLLIALLAELYYLLWCKKKRRPHLQNDYSTPRTRELIFILCCSNTNPSSSSSFSNPKAIETQQQQQQQQQQCPLDDGFTNVVGPGLVPRFLFTIMEETVEEMEDEDCVSIKGKSLNDLFLNMESGGGGSTTPPYHTPRASPSLFTPPLTPLLMESCNGRKEVNSSFSESLLSDAEFNRLVRSSPSSLYSRSPSSPMSRFKFLRDAEDKLYKREVLEIAEAEELKG